MTRGKINGDGKIEVPAWTLVGAIVLGWGFAAALCAALIVGSVERVPLIVGTIIYLIFWPVLQISPVDIVRRMFGSS